VNVALIAPRPSAHAGIRGRLILVLAMSVVLVGLLPGPVSAGWLTDTWPGSSAAPGSEADRVLDIARHQVGKPYRFAAIGPDAFDCSGLVWYVFKTAGLADRMGDKRRGATGYLNWFKANLPNQVSSNLADARPGDILIWGGGKHAGIYISGNWAVSALNSRYDVRIHRADPMGLPFTAVLMVHMSRTSDGSDQSPTPSGDPDATPTPTPSDSPAPPMPPTTFTATAQHDLGVTLSWSGATGDATPLKYRIYRNGVYWITTKETSFVTTLWLPGVNQWQIQTQDANGLRSFRSVSVATTDYVDGTPTNVDDTTPPTTPTNLTAESIGNKQVALTWDASTDSGPTPVGYVVMRGDKPIARVLTPGYVDTPSKVGTYSYSVFAYDGYGNNVRTAKVAGVAEW
jgi:cell wall-associated NlpC family hydrolase